MREMSSLRQIALLSRGRLDAVDVAGKVDSDRPSDLFTFPSLNALDSPPVREIECLACDHNTGRGTFCYIR